jgi:hypothetical protein
MSLLEQIQNKQHNLKTTPNEKKDFTKLHQPVVFTHFFELTTYFILNLSYLFSMKMFCITEADYERLMNETFFERYFEEIRPFTFKSSFIPLSKEDAHLINLLHQEYEQHGEYNIKHTLFSLSLSLSLSLFQETSLIVVLLFTFRF